MPVAGLHRAVHQSAPYGGDTLFADSHAAYHGLPPNIQDRISTLSGINDYGVFLNRGGVEMPQALVADVKARIPFGVAHPLVRTHPETQKPCLYLHGGFLRQEALFDHQTDEPLPGKESLKLVTELLNNIADQSTNADLNGLRVQLHSGIIVRCSTMRQATIIRTSAASGG